MTGREVKQNLKPKAYKGVWCNLVNKPCISEESRDCNYCVRNTAINRANAKDKNWIY